MKTLFKSLVTIIFMLILNSSFGQPYFNPGSIHLVSAESLNVREAPQINAKVVDQLGFAQEVMILTTSDTLFSSNGRTYPFVEILYQMQGEEKRGYIWSGLLASAFTIKGNALYLVKHVKGGDYGQLEATFSLFKQEDEKVTEIHTITNTSIELELLEDFSLIVHSSPGLKNIDHLIEFNIVHIACCSVEEELYFLEDRDGNVVPLPGINNVFCNSELPRQAYIFPKDPGGIIASIILVENEFDLDGNILHQEELQSIAWNGESLSPYKK